MDVNKQALGLQEDFGDGCVEIFPDWQATGKLPGFVLLRNIVPHPYTITLNCLEWTTYCPLTKRPDFARIVISYTPRQAVVETKSMKEYLVAWRSIDIFQEEATNQVFYDLWGALTPLWLKVESFWNNRGGIEESVVVERHAEVRGG